MQTIRYRHVSWGVLGMVLGTLLVALAMLPATALAASPLIIDDEANLLTKEERDRLVESCAPLSEYVDTAFVTVSDNPKGTERFCYEYVNEKFEEEPAVIFAIDMDNREIYVYANQSGLAYVSRADARAITDNIYGLASQGDYFGCAREAFGQVLTKCEGGRIARPVKHVTNALIAVCVAILANFLLVLRSRRGLSASERKETEGTRVATLTGLSVGAPMVLKKSRYRKTGGGGVRGFGGGGGGGGFHGGGGGGGHKF